MEASKFLPEGEPQVPEIRHMPVFNNRNKLPTHHFFLDDVHTQVTIEGQKEPDDVNAYTYRIRFYDWDFAEIDIHDAGEVIELEYVGVPEDNDELAQIQARRLLDGSWGFLELALKNDFPKATTLEDVNSS